MKKIERKEQLALTIFISMFVFAITAVAAVLSLILVYFMLRFELLESVDGRLRLSDLFLAVPVSCTIIGVLLTMLTGKVSLKPLNRLILQLNRLGKGDFKARLKFGKPISKLSGFRGIENSFNAAAEELEHTEMLRNDFINNFSHEFKTPIVSIAGFAKLLRLGNLTEEQKQEALTVIEEESLRLSYMASSVLDLTKVENRTILTDVSRFNLSEQLRSSVLLFIDNWTQKNLTMELEFDEHMITANEELLKQLWLNLLDNAIKFSRERGTVSITIQEGESEITVAISDYGEEIPPESLSRIFNKFYQSDESHSSKGSGIGLTIAKKVVDLHNGTILAESGRGKTTFTVTLPK
ncbi:MAG TPA: HAMP domain-containing histidine kinase [Candidatus Copromorpha excrementigallinarum]|uniref:histidine kinase n=1 Tax=Candidatus Allocopromorpha excrementigallinarum TaxID=2840742 RepID=A0A9D1I2H4_9FIRM|nr:HAMP domain-containing histidine kinase [Candidatus Copromorpha excrementigallinarum]